MRALAPGAQGDDDATGRFVGYTELSISHHRPWWARQGDTGADARHRRRGIGRWLKAHTALRLLRERPEVELIETWNAVGNTPMLAINRAIGLTPAGRWQQWELPVAVRGARQNAATTSRHVPAEAEDGPPRAT